MNLQLPRRLLLAALFAAGAVSSAQAVNYVEIDSANLKFFYDADFWGLNSASVTGNSISFAPSDDFQVLAKSSTASGVGNGNHADYGYLNLFAVAKNGYSVTTRVSASATSSFTFSNLLPGSTGSSSSSVGGEIYGGTYFNGGFSYAVVDGMFFRDGTVTSATLPGGGTNTVTASAGHPNWYFSAVGLDTGAGIAAHQNGKGRTDSVLTDVTYNFTVMAVPEPESYAMMIAGLGLVGLAARRRKTAA